MFCNHSFFEDNSAPTIPIRSLNVENISPAMLEIILIMHLKNKEQIKKLLELKRENFYVELRNLFVLWPDAKLVRHSFKILFYLLDVLVKSLQYF